MGETPQKIPKETKVYATLEDAIREFGSANNVDPDTLRQALEKAKEQSKAPVLQDTKQNLTELAKSVGQNNKVDVVMLGAEQTLAAKTFRNAVKDIQHDFKGWDFTDAQLETNPVFKSMCNRMENEVFGKTSLEWPTAFQAAWMTEATNAMLDEIELWSRDHALTEPDISKFIQKILDRSQGGVGTFEVWFAAKHPKEYGEWTAGRKEVEEKRKATDAAKQGIAARMEEAKKAPSFKRIDQFPSLKAKFAEFEKKTASSEIQEGDVIAFSALLTKVITAYEKVEDAEKRRQSIPETILPASLASRIETLKTQIANEDGTKIDEAEKATATLAQEITDLEALKAPAADPDFPANERERRDALLKEVKEGTKTASDARRDLDVIKKTIPRPETAAEQEEDTGWTQWLGDKVGKASDEPWGDFLINTLKESEVGSESKWAKPLLGVLVTVFMFFTKIVKLPLIGDSARGSWFSNKMLAENGDERAKLFVMLENKLAEFYLPKSLASKIGGMKIKKFLEEFEKKPDQFTKVPARKERIAAFANQLKPYTNQYGEQSILTLINSSEGAKIKYQASPEKPAEPPAAQPAQPTAPAAAPAAQATATPPAAPTQTAQAQPAAPPPAK